MNVAVIVVGAAALAPAPLLDLPTVDDVIAASLAAVGGKEAVENITSFRAVFEMTLGEQKFVNDTSWRRDGGRLSKMRVPGVGEVIMGTDGTDWWMRTAAGYAPLDERGRAQFRSQADMYMIVLEPERLIREETESAEVAGREDFGGAECFRVRFIGKDKSATDVFFDAASGLPAGTRSTQETDFGQQATIMTLEDWRPTAGVKFFRAATIRSSAAAPDAPPMTFAVPSLQVNTVGPEVFAVPAEAKRLIEDQKARQAGPIQLSDLPADQQARATEIIEGTKRAGTPGSIRAALGNMMAAYKYAPQSEKKMYEYVFQELRAYADSLESPR